MKNLHFPAVRTRGCKIIVLSLIWAMQSAAFAQPGGGPSPVVVAEAIERQVAAGQAFVGTVMPSRRSIVGSAVDGRLLEFMVEAGDPVVKDQPIAQLRTKTLELELAVARAELKLRQHELNELENGSRPEEIEQAKAVLARAEALYQYNKARAARTEALYRRGGTTSEEELDQAVSAATAAQQSWIEATAALELVQQGPRQEKIDQAEARVLIQQATIELLEDRLLKFTIRAPFDGYVVAKQTEVGQWVRQDGNVVEIVALDPVEIIVAVPENFIGNLQPGMPATIQLSALPNELLQASVTRIVPQADTRARTFPIIFRLSNPQKGKTHLLKAGMIAQVTLAVGRPQNATLVPKDALVLGGRSPVVFVVKLDPATNNTVVQAIPVQIGVADDSLIQVSGPISAGDQVVVRGNERLQPGMEVRPVRAQP